MRKPTKAPPTDEQIMSYTNVPVDVAGRYIGWNPATIYRALRKQRAPFGTAVENEETKTWSYHISPGALVNYQHGQLPAYRLEDLEKTMVFAVEEILSAKMRGLNTVIDTVVRA